MWMNEYEIDEAVELIGDRAPEAARYAKFLHDWKEVVNSSSDGWPHWKAAGKSAEKLMALVQRTLNVIRCRGGEMPTDDEFRKSLAPIRALATKHKLTAPELADTPAPGFGR